MATAFKLDPKPMLASLRIAESTHWVENTFGPAFERMRVEDPVNLTEEGDFAPYWSVTRYEDIVHVEALPELYSSSWEFGGITVFGDGPESLPEGREPLPMFIAMDRPQHTGQRRTVSPAFTPSEMTRLDVEVRARTKAVLDSLPIDEPFDWVDKVSIELTTGMLAILFDFPWEDRRLLTHWSDWAGDIESIRDQARSDQRWKALWECAAYFTRLWQERASKGEAPDLISRMIHSDATKNMTPQEYLGNLILLIVGGNDTTRNTMSGLAMVATDYPAEWAKIVADPKLIPNAAQELIRWQTPLAHMRRTTTQDVELGGKTIPAKSKIVLWYMSGNRDESVFPNAEAYIADRPNARRHLAFGYGIHRCVGARLAELQVAVLMEELIARGLRPTVVSEPDRVVSSFVHGVRSMQVVLKRA